MKKFLLSLAAVALAGASALAADYTITMKDVAPTDVSSFTAQGFAFTTAKIKDKQPLRTMLQATCAFMQSVR